MIQDLIKKLGGVAAVAEACRISPNAVYKWDAGKEPGIPSRHWSRLRDMSGGWLTLDAIEEVNRKAQAAPSEAA